MARFDPYKNFKFRVEIDGITQAGFSEVSGLGSEVTVIEYREGQDPLGTRKLPGRAIYHDITFRWGITKSKELYEWHRAVLEGNLSRRNVAIVLMDDAGTDVARWEVVEAWPRKYEGPEFKAKGNDVAIESLTLTCENIERVQ